MDAAAKHIQFLRSDILPPLPYQLAKVLDQRFRVPPDDLKLFEERQFRPLQYMTLINADRGLLFTRAYYDMREEPPKPNAAKEGLANSEKKPKTKLSLSDYKNKKKAPSNSPPDTTAPITKPSTLRKEIIDGRPERETDRRDDGKLRETDASRDHKPSRPRDAPSDERPATKPDSRPRHDPNDTPEKRKRAPEDEAARLPKKPRPDVTTPLEDRSRTPRDDTPRRREDRPTPAQSRDHKSGATPSLPNGRGMLKSALGSQSQSATPASRPRGDSLNGHRPASTASNKITPSRHDSSHKTSVPPLLSPLHFSIGGDDASPPKEKRRREEVEEPPRASKPSKVGISAPAKREKARLPALLSPTLPPQVEEELALDRARQRKEGASAPASRSAQPSDPLGGAKKPRQSKDDDREEREKPKGQVRDQDKEDRSGRYVITLQCGKRHAKTLKRLLALPPPRKERSASLETPTTNAARKRPPGASEYIADSIAVKRPRMSDVPSSAKLPPPSTPAKSSTTMARATSNNSQVHTPGEVNSLTPGERPPTRQDPADQSKIRSLRERHERFKNLGNKLKHRRDDLLSPKTGDRPAERDVKLGIALCLESTMAYMVSFRAIFESRRLENKAQDPKTWESILPMLDLVRHDVGDGRQRVLDSLFQHLRGVILEEVIKCHWSLDPVTNARHVMNCERMRSTTWKAAGDAAKYVKNDRMKSGFGPWTGAEEAVTEGLKILRRWAIDEDVDWRAEVTHQMNGA